MNNIIHHFICQHTTSTKFLLITYMMLHRCYKFEIIIAYQYNYNLSYHQMYRAIINFLCVFFATIIFLNYIETNNYSGCLFFPIVYIGGASFMVLQFLSRANDYLFEFG